MTNVHEVYRASSAGESWRWSAARGGGSTGRENGPGLNWQKSRRGTSAGPFEKNQNWLHK